MHIDWAQLFGFSMPWAELVVRGTATYWFLFLIFRFVVRREVGSVGIADILVIVIVADASQNAMAGEYKTVSDGFVLISTIIFWSVTLDRLSYWFPWFQKFSEPPALPLVRDGRMLKRNMRREFISEDELWTKLRENGVDSLDKVESVCLEPDGEFSVIKRKGT